MKNTISDLILQQKKSSRKIIAKLSILLKGANTIDDYNAILSAIKNERKFINYDFSKVNNIGDLVKVIHKTKLNSYNIAKKASINIYGENPINLPGAPAENPANNPDRDSKPAFGNLLAVLESEVQEEFEQMQRRRLPSQNDLRRWALKDAVLEYYKGLNFPPNTQVVETIFDDRLLPDLAPDFDVIYDMWLQRLYDLTRRTDKYTLNHDEYEEAEDDVTQNETGMRGSAFEKQLDRYREYFMQKLQR